MNTGNLRHFYVVMFYISFVIAKKWSLFSIIFIAVISLVATISKLMEILSQMNSSKYCKICVNDTGKGMNGFCEQTVVNID